MDIASLAGIILGAVMFVFGVFSNGGFEALKNMVDSASIIITVGGSISGVLAAHKLPDFINGLNKKVIAFWEKWAELGPAWGMIGTLIGLINMLKNLEDASSIGPAMSVALVTTLYGSLIANWLCNPTASKLKVNNEREVAIKEMIVEGLLSIQAGENPRVIEEKLKSFLTPQAAGSLGEGDEAAGGEA